MLSSSVRPFQSTSSVRPFQSSVAPRKQQPVLPVDLPSLQNASQTLNEQFLKDTQAVPDVGETFSTPASATYSVFNDDYRVPFQKRRLINLPNALYTQVSRPDVYFQLGFFPEIERVWITVDNKLFLWEYLEGEDLDSFVDQPDVITYVALVPAKPSVFIDEITHVLVICTHFHVRLLGVSFSSQPGKFNRTHKPISLYATDMTIACDAQVTSVIGTADGRIFMCGLHDGNLYELHYQQTESWFGKRLQFVNHSISGVQSLLPMFTSSSEDKIVSLYSDRYRGLIYAVTSRQNIHIYQTNGEKAVRQVQVLSNLFKSAQDKAPSSNALNPATFIIVSLCILEPSETRSGVQFIAVLKNATRLYFSPSINYGYSYGGTTGPRPLSLTHVRLPPQNLPDIDEVGQPPRLTGPQYAITSSQQSSPRTFTLTDADCVSYANGLLVISQIGEGPSDQANDQLVCIAPDLARIGNFGQLPSQGTVQPAYPRAYASYDTVASSRVPALTEYAHVTTIPGRLGAIVPVPRPVSKTPAGSPTPNILNDLALQFSEMPREFMMITNCGVTFLVRRRVLDYLKAVLEEVNLRGNIQPIIEFRDSFGRDETCAMLLGLASGSTFMGTPDNSAMNIVYLSSDVKDMASQAFWDFGERPIWTERTTYGSNEPQGTATFSGRRQGLALYFARLVRPIWKAKLTGTNPQGAYELGISDETLVTIQKNLDALKKFLDQNPSFFFASPADTDKSLRPGDQEAWKIEHTSVTELKNLLIRVIEAISFVLLLSDYRLGELVTRCEPDVQKLVTSLTFEELITTQNGITASRALVNVIIDQQIGMQISVDTISEILQSRCGTFCSTDDVMLYKAKEHVRKAVETRNPNDRLNWLNESLRLFSKGARIIQLDKLREIVGDYQQLSYAKGAIELPLLCAQLFDSDEAGLAYWYAGAPSGDSRAEFCERRLQCYDLVLDSLSVFEEQSLKEDNPSSEYQGTRAHAYELAFASDDEMFHSTMYDWLIERGHADELLQMRPAFLEAHLRREPISVQKYQLLWQFYVKDGQPLRAAEVLGTLAESTQFDLSLEARLEYLTLAVGNAKSHPVSGGSKQETAIAFLTDLEEKLEVAQVQLEILSVLQPFVNENEDARERAKVLSSQLLDITILYQEFANHFELNSMKLLCLHVSEHRDENLVRSIWNTLFNEWIEEAEGDVNSAADRIVSKVMQLGQRFYPSEYAFPLRYVAMLIVRFSLSHKGELSLGWAPRALVQCGVPYGEVWDVLHEMYESQVPPFNDQLNVQHTSSDIAVLLNDWLEDVKRPRAFRPEFPVGRIDEAVDQYLAELEPSRTETKALYEGIKRQLRMYW